MSSQAMAKHLPCAATAVRLVLVILISPKDGLGHDGKTDLTMAAIGKLTPPAGGLAFDFELTDRQKPPQLKPKPWVKPDQR
jgi:hypothetical protein